MKRFFILILGCVFVLGMISGCTKEESKAVEKNKDNSEWFNNLETEDVDGNKVTKDMFSSKELTLINVWTTWCGPCVGEMPELETLSKEYESNNSNVAIKGLVVEVEGTDIKTGLSDEEKNLVKDIMKKSGVTYQQLTVSEELKKTDFKRIVGFPTSYFVDKKGNFVGEKVTGANSKEEWKKIIDERLKMVKSNE
ncbi:MULTISPECIES: TlpA disulfide reductase family protein [unclassified Clostridioides]|uniref:TlpA family protein disulfide reductase n=1 Tax=unclassified Clostridioides TaxID=2635829 RepID=UPI001D10F56F|nr:TlpA family protein disulfide reductase [Clostridioides sp. ES-S-0171-01]MCC0689207.1 TlpA family protein disulfide reductase [Clostridioides sp. ES-S-0056-01]MCC0715426.1 TlpA family protein disulfide reductase [Clostridioides sp. ES-S-0077-01]UDN55966.1 TlpA family protein disulfide reductase [Clostridioides sp. ES-S-0054-01]